MCLFGQARATTFLFPGSFQPMSLFAFPCHPSAFANKVLHFKRPTPGLWLHTAVSGAAEVTSSSGIKTVNISTQGREGNAYTLGIR